MRKISRVGIKKLVVHDQNIQTFCKTNIKDKACFNLRICSTDIIKWKEALAAVFALPVVEDGLVEHQWNCWNNGKTPTY